MMYQSQLDRWPARIYRPNLLESGVQDEAEKTGLIGFGTLDEVEKVGLLGSRVLDEAEKMVLFSVALAGFWCFLGPFS